jgi:N-formylglutamate deformylase
MPDVIFEEIGPVQAQIPLVLSIPHSGTKVTESFKQNCASPQILELPDTDWYVHHLYDFCTKLGIPAIRALYSRYIVDLNRPRPGTTPLYEKRSPTGLVPLRTFSQQSIYKQAKEPSETEIEQRVEFFYDPYHRALYQALESCIKVHGIALLVDAHSIRSEVTSIQAEPFADLILGNRSGKTCPMDFLVKAREIFQSHDLTCALNDPFQGGQITRHFHGAFEDIFCLQIEMSQRIYMDEESLQFPGEGWNKTRRALQEVIAFLGSEMSSRRLS